MSRPLFPQTAASLGLLCIWVFGLWFVHVLRDLLTELADFPPDLFRGPGMLALVPESLQMWLLSHVGLSATKGLLLVLLIALTPCFTYFLVGLNRILHHAEVLGDGTILF